MKSINEILKKEEVIVVDVRNTWEYEEGHVNNAVNIPLNEIPARIDEFRRLNGPVILYCHSGNRSGAAVQILKQAGITNVYNGGGILDMQKNIIDMKLKMFYLFLFAGLFAVQSASAQDTTGLAIQQARFEKLMKKKNTYVVDVRTPEEYESGFIVDAVNYNVMDSVAFVNTILSLDKNKKYLLYCKSGRRSGKALVMMKNMGFRKVYQLNGGVTEWKGELKKSE